MFLRHQLLVLRRSAPPRLRLRTTDRLIFVWLYWGLSRWYPWGERLKKLEKSG
jgi:hypothetical protein